jgi:hypothetical protein
VSEHTTAVDAQRQLSINLREAKGCIKKTKNEKRENILLDGRPPFMNRVGKRLYQENKK